MSPPVMATELADLLEREAVELHYPRPGAECGRHNAPRFFLGVQLHNDPRLVLPVHAAPVCTSEEMGPGPEKHLRRPGTLCRFIIVRHLDEESCHGTRSPV